MREYRRAPHAVYTLHDHFVFIAKYRKPVLRGDIGPNFSRLQSTRESLAFRRGSFKAELS